MFKLSLILFLYTSLTISSDVKTLTLAIAESPEKSIQMKRTVAILREAFRRISYNLKVSVCPAARCLKASNAGIYDGEAQRVYELKARSEFNLENLIRVPEPHQSIDLNAFVFGNDVKINSKNPKESLKNLKVIIKRGIVSAEAILKKEGVQRVVRVTTYSQMFKMLIARRGDVAIGFPGLKMPGGLLNKAPFKDLNIKMLSSYLRRDYLYIYLHKKHVSIVPLVSKKLAEMKKDGTFQKIIKSIY